MKVLTKYSKKKYKFYSIFYLVTGIIIALLGALIAIAALPVGIIILLIGAFLIMKSRQYKKSSIEGGFSKEIENFIATSEVKGHIKFNDNTKQVLISPNENPRIINYSDILSFRLIQNGKTIDTSEHPDNFFERLTHRPDLSTTISVLKIQVLVKDMNNPNAYIKLINRPTELDNYMHGVYFDIAYKILSMLQIAKSQV